MLTLICMAHGFNERLKKRHPTWFLRNCLSVAGFAWRTRGSHRRDVLERVVIGWRLQTMAHTHAPAVALYLSSLSRKPKAPNKEAKAGDRGFQGKTNGTETEREGNVVVVVDEDLATLEPGFQRLQAPAVVVVVVGGFEESVRAFFVQERRKMVMMLLQDSDSYSASLSLCSDSVSSSSVSVSFNLDDGDTADSSCSSESQPQSESRVGPLTDLGSLRNSLPSKKGLSTFFGGKSQSFTSFTDIKCVDELAKPENPYNEYYRIRNQKRVKKTKLKGCRSCGSSLLGICSSSSSSMISKAPHKSFHKKIPPKKDTSLVQGRGFSACFVTSTSAKCHIINSRVQGFCT